MLLVFSDSKGEFLEFQMKVISKHVVEFRTDLEIFEWVGYSRWRRGISKEDIRLS